MKSKNVKRNGLSKGLKGLLIAVVVLGVGTGITAAVTKGFKEWGVAERAVKGGTVVDKFVIDNISRDEAQFIDADEFKLNVGFEGALQDEKAVLGSKTEEADFAKKDFEDYLDAAGVSSKKAEEIVEYVVKDDVAKISSLGFDLKVQFDEEEATKSMKKLPWFDTVRINYKLPGERMIMTSNSFNDSYVFNNTKRINTITSLYEDISLMALEEDDTLSENYISFMSATKAGEVDNTAEIQSIEFLRKSNKHQNDYCWIAQ